MEQLSTNFILLNFTDEHTSGLLVGVNLEANEPCRSRPGYNPLKLGSITLQVERLQTVSKKMGWGDALTA